MDRKIRVGMDISQFAHKGGVAIYTKNLAERLSKFSELEMVYFYSSLRHSYRGNLQNVRFYKLPPTLFEILFNRWRNVTIERFIDPVDIFHSSDWIQPKTKAKKVTTYHDVAPLKYPQWSHPKIVDVHKRRLKLVEKEIDMVIAVSESTKRDLLEITEIPENKVTVIYEGPTISDSASLPGDAWEAGVKRLKEKYNLPEKFILAIGGGGGRKNLERIREACRDYNLVITGVTLPWLNEDEVGMLYKSAGVLLYCSLYEGFGLPILDAFTSGLPVITSNVSSMPEVGGDAVLYVDPYNVQDIKNKLDVLMNDEKLRQSLIRKGFARVKQFSWEKAAKETADLYRRLVK